MRISATRLDRFIRAHSSFPQSAVRALIAQKRIQVDAQCAHSVQQVVTAFSRIMLDGECLQDGRERLYMMLHKPQGVVSATQDAQHRTALDLIDHPHKDQLHIVGRLDINSTGLLLFSNDGAWSRRISLPASRCLKCYEVTLAQPLNASAVAAFAQGMYFAYENITTQPAELIIHTPYTATVSLTEGKYHQVKRMFAALGNRVMRLHRRSVGGLSLGDLAVGQSRLLTASECLCLAPFDDENLTLPAEV